MLSGNQQPDYIRIIELGRLNLETLSDLFVQILRLCQKAGMVSLGHVAVDGTKVQANPYKHKTMSVWPRIVSHIDPLRPSPQTSAIQPRPL